MHIRRNYMINQSRTDFFTKVIFILLICSVISRLWVAFIYEVNWDEFLFLSKIYLKQRGTLGDSLQTAYVYLFEWVTLIPGYEVEQVIAGRLFMWGLHCGTLMMLYYIAKDLLDIQAALFAVLSYSVFSYVTLHAASFRADPLVGFLMMAATSFVYFRRPTIAVILWVSLLVATAILISLKAVLLIPMMVAIAVIKLTNENEILYSILRYVIMATSIAVLFVVLHHIHSSLLNTEEVATTTKKVSGIYNYVIQKQNFLPRWPYITKTLTLTDPYYYLMVASGFIFVVYNLFTKSRLDKKNLFLLAFSLPPVAFVFYRNAFPYFFPFILSTMSLLAGYSWSVISHKSMPKVTIIALLFLLSMSGYQIYRYGFQAPSVINNEYQKQLINVVHKIFPDPVPYIDGNSMIASFPKIGFFMSTWGMNNYRIAGLPKISMSISKNKPVFLLQNTTSSAFKNMSIASNLSLFPDDIKAIRQNFIPHWGPILVAGVDEIIEKEGKVNITLPFPGRYTAELTADVYINGKKVSNGDVLDIDERDISVFSPNKMVKFTLRYGDNLYRPDFMPLSEIVYMGFYAD